MTTLVGGVGELYQGDLDLGRRAAERLATADLGQDVLVEDLYYGAIAVVHRLEEVRPHTLVLVGAAARGREPGTVERRRIEGLDMDPADLQVAVGDAATGYVTMELVVEVAWGLGALPPRTITIEVEPAPHEGPREELSAPARAGLARACELVTVDVARAPLFEIAAQLRERCTDEPRPSAPAAEAMRRLLDELDVLDVEGRWGATFRYRDHVRAGIAGGATPQDMTNLDWVLWWALLEELDRLGALEAVRDR